MTNPEAEEPHAIADTQVFRRFVEQAQSEVESKTFFQKLWVWPGLLVPVIVSIVIVVVVIILLTK